jgi:hypothetical protein
VAQYEAKYTKFLFLVAVTLIVVVQSIVQSEDSTLQFSLTSGSVSSQRSKPGEDKPRTISEFS